MNIIIALLLAISLPFYHYSLMKIYQLSYYRLGEFFNAVIKKKAQFFLLGILLPVFAFFLCAILYEITKKRICIAFFVTLQAIIVGIYSYKSSKTKVNFTARIIRFIVLFIILSFIVFFPLIRIVNYYSPLLIFLSPLTFVLSHLIITPIENARNKGFIKRAKARLQKINPICVGITGSYGKTTAKNILYQMLSQKYKTHITPLNYNTPMGIAKAIMSMDEGTEVFIAEMGARYKGDIKELCEIVPIKYSILTAIGNQHLETFKSEKTLIETKCAIISASKEGACVVNGDCVDISKIKMAKHCKVSSKTSTLASYSSVKYSTSGVKFTLSIDGERIEMETKLLGKHIPSCVCACAYLSKIMGISGLQIKKAVTQLKPVAHRLELLYNGSDIIIDDAYNANEEGMKNALDILSAFSSKVRILITPGIIELGKEQYAVNKKMGEYTASRCDYALFIGSNGKALYDGATSKAMENSFVFSTLNEAMEKLKTIKGERAILFENDLPDES